ncbi:unnamed protein product [Choristocarpus tenellus]
MKTNKKVWSVSYGLPEKWQCYAGMGPCEGVIHGYDPEIYLQRANVELAKLAALGVTVLVSSGDDGSPGFSLTCPIDPKLPVSIGGEEHSCPFEDKGDCRCATFSLEIPRCILPLGAVAMAKGVEGAPGGDCLRVLNNTDCVTLLTRMDNGGGGGGGNGTGSLPVSNGTCQADFFSSNLSFYSDCECGDIPTEVEGSCTLSGYSFETSVDDTVFAPDFPASSPWVTSVGGTQVAWDLGGSCKQSDLLGPDNIASAETAVNKYTGGFDGGGGFSTTFGAHDYQTDHTAAYVASGLGPQLDTYNSTNR